MNPERWTRLQRIFNEAVEAPVAERASILSVGCGTDAELRREVEEMLALDAGSEDVLRHAIGGAVTDAVHGEHNRLIGTVIGSYRIKGVLGYGGMGTVYDAERADDTFRQRVAVKLVQQMAVHPQLRARLRAERQILANLDHPYIARLIDGGELPNGTPYLVIEYVHGVSIDEYCDKHKLGVHERLELFEKVCAAVDYAHRNLVVHRDLKPANILVTEDGTPKLLDFGIAKLLNPDPAWATVAAVTRVQDRLLTPEHASPEQVLGRTITTASDVYALGVLLYELLCGRSPYALKNSTPLALERAICNEDPTKPSGMFRKAPPGVTAEDGFDPRQVAQLRGVGHEKLARQLSGDIDEIILKAMRKEPEQRYATAGQLADELRRHRAGDAVLARQGVRRYRVAKFLRRNAVPVAMAGVVMVSLMTFATFMWLKTQELQVQRDVAEQEKEWAEETSSLLVNIFKAADPYETNGDDITATQLLDKAAGEMMDRQKDPMMAPEVRARMLDSIGFAQQRYGGRNKNKSIPLLEEALEIRRSTGAPSEDIATNLLNLGDALRSSGSTDSAATMYDEALRMYTDLFGSKHERVAMVLVSQARLEQQQRGNPSRAKRLLLEAREIFRNQLGSTHQEVGSTLSDLASVAIWQDDWTLAEQYQKEALEIYKLRHSHSHPDYATAVGALGQIQVQRKNFIEAEKNIDEAHRVLERAFGPDNARVADALDTKSKLLEQQEKYELALAPEEEALATLRRIQMGSSTKAGYFEDSLGFLKYKLGRLTEAEEHMHSALAIYAGAVPPDHPYIASSQHTLGEILLAQGDAAAALEALRVAIDICVRKYGDQHWRTARSRSALGEAMDQLGYVDDAKELLTQSHAVMRDKLGKGDTTTQAARNRLTSFLRKRGLEREAARLLEAPAP